MQASFGRRKHCVCLLLSGLVAHWLIPRPKSRIWSSLTELGARKARVWEERQVEGHLRGERNVSRVLPDSRFLDT
jgi:hypothetical protein